MLAIAFERLVQAENLEPTDVAPLVNRIAWMVRRVTSNNSATNSKTVLRCRRGLLGDDRGKPPSCFGSVRKLVREFPEQMKPPSMHGVLGQALGMCFQLMDGVIDVLSD